MRSGSLTDHIRREAAACYDRSYRNRPHWLLSKRQFVAECEALALWNRAQAGDQLALLELQAREAAARGIILEDTPDGR